MSLLSSNTKIDKSVELFPEYEAVILQMLPGKGVCKDYFNCLSTCLAFTGYGKFTSVRKGRQKRKDLYLQDLPAFMKTLEKELNNLCKRARKKGKKPVCRLNGFTDIDWQFPEYFINGVSLFEAYQEIQFWDYTADIDKALLNQFENYHLTFSYKNGKHGNNLESCRNAFSMGLNIAVVDLPENREVFKGQSISGDTHDFRWLDAKGQIVWLTEKKVK